MFTVLFRQKLLQKAYLPTNHGLLICVELLLVSCKFLLFLEPNNFLEAAIYMQQLYHKYLLVRFEKYLLLSEDLGKVITIGGRYDVHKGESASQFLCV